jgi:alkaline phosphatase
LKSKKPLANWRQIVRVVGLPIILISIVSFWYFKFCGSESANISPAANAGEDQIVTLKISSLSLDGSNSTDAEGEILSYRWSLVAKPSTSNALLSGELSANPILTYDVEGVYRISLIVSDGINNSFADTVDVTVVASVKNMILLIGDGMGFEQVKAAGMYLNGKSGTLGFEDFPSRGSVSDLNASGKLVESASAATSMATGKKVNNGVISVSLPGDGSPLETILEKAKARGLSTGLVTTSTISDATPAAFAAHEPSRKKRAEIIGDFLTETRPNVLLGGAQFINRLTAETAGYTVVEDSRSLALLDKESVVNLWGQFGKTVLPYEYDGLDGLPHLSESTAAALAILDNDPDGFFLMIEGGRIDHAGHKNDIQRNILETVEFSKAVQVVKDWAVGRSNTLIIVTADHETGGLQVIANNGAGRFPDVIWTTASHTVQPVPVYAWGANAHLLKGKIDNIEIYDVLRETLQ